MTERYSIVATDYCGPKAKDCKPGEVIQFTDTFKFPTVLDYGVKLLILQEADIAGIEEEGSYRPEMLFDRREVA
mgnify:CR=1 FL=1